jgi:hypothetical protein
MGRLKSSARKHPSALSQSTIGAIIRNERSVSWPTVARAYCTVPPVNSGARAPVDTAQPPGPPCEKPQPGLGRWLGLSLFSVARLTRLFRPNARRESIGARPSASCASRADLTRRGWLSRSEQICRPPRCGLSLRRGAAIRQTLCFDREISVERARASYSNCSHRFALHNRSDRAALRKRRRNARLGVALRPADLELSINRKR